MHHEEEHRDANASQPLKITLFLVLVVMVAEILGGGIQQLPGPFERRRAYADRCAGAGVKSVRHEPGQAAGY